MNKDTQELKKALLEIVQTQQPEAGERLQTAVEKLKQDYTLKRFFYLFAISQRWFAKANTNLKPLPQSLDKFRVTEHWEMAQFARLSLLLELDDLVTPTEYVDTINKLFATADVNELIILVQSLQFIPGPERFVERAREAARSNIASVFSALAHQSDYALRYFDHSGWNQLILKAAFLATPIWSIQGLRERNNPELVLMLLNYVRERQAASRIVPWDLWACVGWLTETEEDRNKLSTQFEGLDTQSRGAIILSLQENSCAEASKLAQTLASSDEKLKQQKLTWNFLASLREQ